MHIQNSPQKHHFVPECYLKNFIKEKEVFTLDLSGLKKGYKVSVNTRQPAQICYLFNFYLNNIGPSKSSFTLNNHSELYIEVDVLKILENKFKGFYERLISDDDLPLQDTIHLCDFIVQMKLRNPYWRGVIKKKAADWISEVIEKGLEEADKKPEYSEIPRELKNALSESIKANNLNDQELEKHIQLFSLSMRANRSEEDNRFLRSGIIDSKWQLYRAPEGGPYFITTDNPGAAFGRDGLYYNSKFNEGAQFFFPLSYRYCLAISDVEKDHVLSQNKPTKCIVKKVIPPLEVIKINDCLIQMANKLLVAADDWYISQILELNKPAKK